MFGAPKITAGLSIPRVLEIASTLNGKPNLFDQLLPLIDSIDKRYQLAKRYNRHRIAIDVICSSATFGNHLKVFGVLGFDKQQGPNGSSSI